MSADNGIYVLFTQSEKGPEYRVAYANAIDNIYGEFNAELGRYEGNIQTIQEIFKDAPVFYNVNEAMDHAEIMEQEYDYLEDGVALINEFKEYGYIFE